MKLVAGFETIRLFPTSTHSEEFNHYLLFIVWEGLLACLMWTLRVDLKMVNLHRW